MHPWQELSTCLYIFTDSHMLSHTLNNWSLQQCLQRISTEWTISQQHTCTKLLSHCPYISTGSLDLELSCRAPCRRCCRICFCKLHLIQLGHLILVTWGSWLIPKCPAAACSDLHTLGIFVWRTFVLGQLLLCCGSIPLCCTCFAALVDESAAEHQQQKHC